MWPTLFTLHVFSVERPVGSYGAMLSLAMLVGGTLVIRAAQRERLDIGLIYVLLATTILGAFVGGYLFFVVVELIRTGDVALALLGGGRVFFGSFLGGIAAFAWCAKKLTLPGMRIADLSVPAIAWAHAIGRIGCLLGGCCFGSGSDAPWALTARDPLAPSAHPPIARHPTAIYEALLVLLIAIVVAKMPIKKPYAGQRFVAYVVLYCVARFLLEFVRGDAQRGVLFGILSTSQLMSVALCVVALILHSKWAHASVSAHAVGASPTAGSA
ncbi:MAG: prolipoprotein diacylglyceryl transferase [Sandaracinaceae bacterium]|jgi:phosphatidylglycerol:prolipoprotein diacylglycerol transferase|nr:prolipoprotein diacylglyceryl transferase [Sandaracinaceae bacterium]